MGYRQGEKTIILNEKPKIKASVAVVGEKEQQGPLGEKFDIILTGEMLKDKSFEQSESFMLKTAIKKAISDAGLENSDIDGIFSGDLLNQCIGSNFAVREFGIPLCGLYGACSTMALSLIMASLSIESGGFNTCISATSSHFCTAERQFRKPLEYGGQRPPTAQWTVTGSGAVLLTKNEAAPLPYIDSVHLGTIQDLGITDANNMGAAMAPAARKTISDFLRDTKTKPSDYDMILTGDLGFVGSTLLKNLLLKQDDIDITNVHKDCGIMIYDPKEQDVHAGGSGCGCSASVVSSYILKGLNSGEFDNILFVATGALMSTTSSLQGESILGIAHGVNFKSGKK